MPAIAALLGAVEIADETLRDDAVERLRQRLSNLADFVPERDLLLAEVDGRLVAFAERIRGCCATGRRSHQTFGRVAPDWRRHGLGRAMLRFDEAQASERSAARRRRARQHRPASRVVEPRPGGRGRRAARDRRATGRVRWFFEMVRPLGRAIPDSSLPDGIELRPVTDALARAVLRGRRRGVQGPLGRPRDDRGRRPADARRSRQRPLALDRRLGRRRGGRLGQSTGSTRRTTRRRDPTWLARPGQRPAAVATDGASRRPSSWRRCASSASATWTGRRSGSMRRTRPAPSALYERLGFRPRQALRGLPQAALSSRPGGPVASGTDRDHRMTTCRRGRG